MSDLALAPFTEAIPGMAVHQNHEREAEERNLKTSEQ